MTFSDYDPTKPPAIEYSNSEDAIYPWLEAIAPKRTHDCLYKLAAYYKWIDAICLELSRNAVCGSGCPRCCAQTVAVKPIEVEYIKSKMDGRVLPRTPGFCPLLNVTNRTCAVYEYRPLVCRTLFAFNDPKYCASDGTQHVHSLAQLQDWMEKTLAQMGDLGVYIAKHTNELFAGPETTIDAEF